ncbi:bifunctional riboflavin kinase/FAD synthetase [Hyphobacterium sp. HN65]|uniref:Riboflavin biosynthesis protein n=1 Tax=Hyphobacterium lacteum TaxID=3116575 RepID=A0ABU7LN79_9PROT|nr:bifunctional riboflavin kinase/FAD synthetase [Hyphobacterium sp. HN65]MEE2525370.1 bifunctional riboflavin kinase/FAD synthetase [Hyphobacterium sp. HN65]
MQIVYGSPQTLYPPCALALGNFDGVHLGHQVVLGAALERAADMGLAAAVAVFDPHPRRFFQPDAPPFRLMDDTQQADALADLGFDRMHVLPFDTNMASMMPREFAETVLSGWANIQHVYVGSDFEFGKGRSGDVAILTGIGEQIGFSVSGMKLKSAGDSKISSSRVRELLMDGKVAAAAGLLGRFWAIRGEIDRGDQRGRTIGFPTANIPLGEYCRPKFGVYAVRMQLGDRVIPGVANIGVRPTVDGAEERLEVHLFNFAEDIYGETVSVELVEFLRPEQKFNGLDALKAQIASDADAARKILANL